MKTTTTLILGMSTLLFLGLGSFDAPAADGEPFEAGMHIRAQLHSAPAELDFAADDGPDAAIEQAMEQMHRGGKAVRRALRKKQVDAALVAVSIAQQGVVEAKKLVPSAALELEGEARARLKADFRKRLIEVLEKWLQVEKLLIDGKMEQAATAMKEISVLEKSGHKEYEVED
ncbi:MAG: hypothetical protein OSB09_05580 [Planctomycetota bacterium]|nr:hypothetical protein [Planctomycetota bacterium]